MAIHHVVSILYLLFVKFKKILTRQKMIENISYLKDIENLRTCVLASDRSSDHLTN